MKHYIFAYVLVLRHQQAAATIALTLERGIWAKNSIERLSGRPKFKLIKLQACSAHLTSFTGLTVMSSAFQRCLVAICNANRLAVYNCKLQMFKPAKEKKSLRR